MNISLKFIRYSSFNVYYKFVFFDISFINTYQVWSINITFMNIFFKLLNRKK